MRLSKLAFVFCLVVVFGTSPTFALTDEEKAMEAGFKCVQDIIRNTKTVQFSDENFDRNLELKNLQYNSAAQSIGADLLKMLKDVQKGLEIKIIGFVFMFFKARFVAEGIMSTTAEQEERQSEFEKKFLEKVLYVGPLFGIGTSIHDIPTTKNGLKGSIRCTLMSFSTGSKILDILNSMLEEPMQMSLRATGMAIEFRKAYAAANGEDAERNVCSNFTKGYAILTTPLNGTNNTESSLLSALSHVKSRGEKEFMKALKMISKIEFVDEEALNAAKTVSYGISSWQKDKHAYMAIFYAINDTETFPVPLRKNPGIHVPQALHPTKTSPSVFTTDDYEKSHSQETGGSSASANDNRGDGKEEKSEVAGGNKEGIYTSNTITQNASEDKPESKRSSAKRPPQHEANTPEEEPEAEGEEEEDDEDDEEIGDYDGPRDRVTKLHHTDSSEDGNKVTSPPPSAINILSPGKPEDSKEEEVKSEGKGDKQDHDEDDEENATSANSTWKIGKSPSSQFDSSLAKSPSSQPDNQPPNCQRSPKSNSNPNNPANDADEIPKIIAQEKQMEGKKLKHKEDREEAIYKVITNYRSSHINLVKRLLPHEKEVPKGRRAVKIVQRDVLKIIRLNTELPPGGLAILRESNNRNKHARKRMLFFRMEDFEDIETFMQSAEKILKIEVKCSTNLFAETFNIKRLDLEFCGAAVEVDPHNLGKVIVGVILVPKK